MSTVRYLAPDTDAYVDFIVQNKSEFEQQSGLTLETHIIPTDAYYSNQIGKYLDSEEPPDVFMSGPVLLWEHLGKNRVQPLDDFVANASEEFDFDDFYPRLIQSNRWSTKFGDRLGHGPLWEIPVNWESYNLVYHPGALERARLDVPRTWDDYLACAHAIARLPGQTYWGFAQRGMQVWHTMYTGFATQYWTCGGTDFNSDGTCAIAGATSVSITTQFIEGLKKAGPPDWTNRRWYELAMDFAAGKYGLMVDSDHYVAYFENVDTSRMARHTGYALPPTNSHGDRKPNMWTWSLAMNARSKSKRKAWQFMEWAAGKSVLERTAYRGNMNPTRRSIWNSEVFQEYSAPWGAFYPVSTSLVEDYAQVLVTPSVRYREIADRWVTALLTAYQGTDVSHALSEAAADIDTITSNKLVI